MTVRGLRSSAVGPVDHGRALEFGISVVPEAAALETIRFELGLGAGAFWDAVEAMGGPRRATRASAGARTTGWSCCPTGRRPWRSTPSSILWPTTPGTEQVERFATQVAPRVRAEVAARRGG
jgi:hypothetical protein